MFGILTDVKEKFAKARELCPGMTDGIYAVTDYLAMVANDRLEAVGVATVLALVMADLEEGRCGFADGAEFPQYLAEHSEDVILQLPYILWVIDAIAEPDFASDVRVQCFSMFRWSVPKRASIPDDVGEYVIAAADWWTKAVRPVKRDDNSVMSRILAIAKRIRGLTEMDWRSFREKLIELIAREMKNTPSLNLTVEYYPCALLKEASSVIDLDWWDFPTKTEMRITRTEVFVWAWELSPKEVVWKAEEARD